jgi:hypothetical protein
MQTGIALSQKLSKVALSLAILFILPQSIKNDWAINFLSKTIVSVNNWYFQRVIFPYYDSDFSLSNKTYYIRPDGGSTEQCTGLKNIAYPGVGSGQECAWDHPFRAFPPHNSPRINGGDTLIIASGDYMMGYGAPETSVLCSREGAFDCIMPPIPGGLDVQHPTRILGEGWDSGCTAAPELWGTQRAYFILNLTDTSFVEINCLEVTDHSGCVEFHAGELRCERDTYPFGDWASTGLYAEDSQEVYLKNINIHGLAHTGIHAGRLTDWVVEKVRIAGNGWAGWDGDIIGEDSNSGDLYFTEWVVAWNGCGETYPEEDPSGCWAQSAGGYGDGVGTGATAGNWIIEDSSFLYNTSDGLDLLYHTLGGSISLNRVHAEGNAGNQVKLTGEADIINGVFVGNCAFFDGKSFTYNVDACRALGNTLSIAYTGGEQVSLYNSSLYGQGDGLVSVGPHDGFSCNGSETLTGGNNIFLGDVDYFQPNDITFLYYQEDCGSLKYQGDHNIAYSVKNYHSNYVEPPFPSTNNLIMDPQLSGFLDNSIYSMMPLIGSPVIDAGDNSICSSLDILKANRPTDGDQDGIAICDLGAYEIPVFVFLSFIVR